MTALVKVLFGDARNVAVVALAVALDAALAAGGYAGAAALLVPPVLLFGVRWLAAA
ncbi:MAG: hypothetical protein ACHQF3_12355 [Alphaproteobacteria bacterium]